MSETPPEDPEPNGHEPEQHKRVSHWDRPKPPHDWRWVVGGIGRTLITLGLLMFGFVAYQLWGTGIQTAQAQRQLVKDFDKLVGAPDSSTTTTTTSPPTTTIDTGTTLDTVPVAPTTTTTTLPALPPAKPIPADGEGVARLEIPRMNLHRIVVEGATAGDLAKGPGHFPETPLPGQPGNAAIAGHRTTHGHPFYDIDELRPGDEIIVTTLNGRYVYSVTDTVVVSPSDYADVIPTTDATKATLTLVSCTPRYSSANRIVVHSELLVEKSDPLTQAAPITLQPGAGATLPDEGAVTSSATVADTAAPDTAATETTSINDTTVPAPATTAAVGEIPTDAAAASPDAFADGWFSDASAIPQAILWGALLAAIAYGILRLSRKVRHYSVGIVAGIAPFVVVLYFFYENVNRLLPPNL